MTLPPGLLCLEGEWTTSLKDRKTVEPVLRLLESAGENRVIHRDVGTREELEFYVNKWTQKRYERYALAYLAFHGEPGCLWVGREKVTLGELGESLEGRCTGRVIYMGSCATLAAPDDELRAFCRITGAKALVGYTRYVDWIESTAFDVLLLWELTHAKNIKPVYSRLVRQYPDLTHRLGLRMAMTTWVSDRKPAQKALQASTS